MATLTIKKNNQSLSVLAAAEFVSKQWPVDIREGATNTLNVNSTEYSTLTSILRFIARSVPQLGLYGQNALERSEVDHWLDFSSLHLSCSSEFVDSLAYLDSQLSQATYIVGYQLTIADIAIWSSLYGSDEFQTLTSTNKAPKNVLRYFNMLSAKTEFKKASEQVPKSETGKQRKEEGKFIELPGAEMGKVVVRFPPEASGYLHIGHAKAALLNQYYQQTFNGKLIFRFDDTNPAKENAEFEQVILKDIEMLGLKPDLFTHTSDHFDLIQKYCEKMLRDGTAYVDDTEPEKMKQEREQRIESASRKNSVEKNLALWKEMMKGSPEGLKCCVRAKIDMAHDIGCMRDPTLYRCKLEPHVRTGDKYKVYPTYDFACPIVDSVENVTHALRTTEYHDRDEQYYWILDALGLRKPYIYEYSRLNLQNTVMSKRRLTWFVDEKIVDGWDDPRFPTVRGVLRRGMTVDGLKEFIVAQGSSRSINMMEWDKIWAFNRKVIDPIAPRFTALLKSDIVPVTVHKAVVESKQVPRHPKDAAIGMRSVWYGPSIFIDGADAELLKEGETVTFINWGNLVIQKINKGKDGKIQSMEASLALENTDYKKTQKITWLADVDKAPPVATLCLHYDHIITKPVLDKEEDFKQYINRNSKVELQMLGDPELASLKKGDIIQLQRRGYYICDVPYEAPSRHSCKASPCVLIKIPDGHTKEMPTSGSKHKETGDAPAPAAAAATPVAKSKGKDNKAAPAAKDTPAKENKNQPKADNKAQGASKAQPAAAGGTDALSEQVRLAGEKVRQLKADKAAKADIDAAVKGLLQLKADYKSATGADWQPGAAPGAAPAAASQPAAAPASAKPVAGGADALSEQVRLAGEKVRQLKADKAAKADIDAAVKVLLQLKADYKSATGIDWQPTTAPAAASNAKQTESKPTTAPSAMGDSSSAAAAELKQKIDAQGEVVRQLKASKAAKENIDAEVKKLLALKEDYKKLTGEDVAGGQARPKKEEKPKAAPVAKPAAADAEGDGDSREVKKVSRLGLEAKKAENLPDWYSQVITKAEMIEYYDISGCYVLRPWAYGIWERIANWFDAEIKKIGFENCYFPIFVSAAALEKEKEHIEDFAPEVAWVTRSGKTDLAEPIAIRPTSETVMYPSYAKWVQSHRDLPIKLNQWNNVVRWEFKHPQPFLRTREFLWQEGHSAYAGYDEAEKEVYHILGLYENIYENLLAIPVTKGKKTKKEKFAGGDYTTTVEVYISASGRGIQAATSHHLGQNFSKMFDISFEDPDTKERRFAYQNSWAITTRSLGIIVMTHGDDKGLVLPPRIAPIQVVVVPCGITVNTSAEDQKKLMDGCESLCDELTKAGVRVKGDYRDNYSPGWKFNHWELKGVPVRVELGPRDLQKGELVAVRRDTGDKVTYKRSSAVADITALIENIHNSLFSKAKKDLDDNTAICFEFDAFCKALEKKKVILAPFCGGVKCEERIKETSANNATAEPGAAAMGAKSLCIPFKQPAAIKDTDKCIGPDCKEKPTDYVLFGRSY